jgi:hypothetical protein
LVSAHRWSQWCSVIGACLLLGPTLFLSFSQANVQLFLFLPSLGIPSFLALSLTGILLLGTATLMLWIRPRLTVLWSEMS